MSILLESLRTETNVFLLSSKKLHLFGDDIESYLNSQTTNNVKNLLDGHYQFNSVLDLSGKIISTFILVKENSKSFFIITPDDFIDQTLERIEKFHISEDFEYVLKNEDVFLGLNYEGEGFFGKYFFEGDKILFEFTGETNKDHSSYKALKCLTGVTRLGEEVTAGTIINNTIFNELSVDYNKGCFPGQETVAKINTRRGAALYPVLLISENKPKIGQLIKKGKKVGEILNFVHIDQKYFSYAVINRENRIEGININAENGDNNFDFELSYFPYLKPDKRTLAVDLYDYGMECFYQEDNSSALNYFNKAIEVDPSYEDAYESLGVLYGRLEKFDMAIKTMEDLKNLNPKCMMAYTNLSLYHMKSGNIEIAEDYKSQATLLNFEILGDEAEKKRQAEELEKRKLAERDRREGMFKQVLEMDPEDAMANNGMGEIEFERKQFDLAENYFKNAISGNKKYSVAYLGLGKSLYFQNKLDQSRKVLEEGISIASKNGDLMPANEMQTFIIKLDNQ